MIPAIIAAAGKSSRMGPPKQLLPWGNSTVLATVISKLGVAGVDPVVCVLGREREKIAASLVGSVAHLLENPAYETTEMVRSFQIGLTYLQKHEPSPYSGALLSLGDQPHISPQTLRTILTQIDHTPHKLVIPSHNMRRGHPFYIPRSIWQDVLQLDAEGTLREVLHAHRKSIEYAVVESDDVLWDIDTPKDYEAMRARWA